LLTQSEIFQDERLSMDEEAAQKTNEQDHPGILAGAGKSNDFRLDGVFADYAWELRSFTRLSSVTSPRAVLDGCLKDLLLPPGKTLL
jgi:hypothetical protein